MSLVFVPTNKTNKRLITGTSASTRTRIGHYIGRSRAHKSGRVLEFDIRIRDAQDGRIRKGKRTGITAGTRLQLLRALNLAMAPASRRQAGTTRKGGDLFDDDRGVVMNGENGNGVKKRKAVAYEEDVEGFQFSRATSRPKKSRPSPVRETVDRTRQPSHHSSSASPPPQPKRSVGRPPAQNKRGPMQPAQSAQQPRRLSFSDSPPPTKQTKLTRKRQPPRQESDEEPVQQKGKEKDKSRSTRVRRKEPSPVDATPPPISMPKKRVPQTQPPQNAAPARGPSTPEPPEPPGTQKIALPFADTPVMRKNKEMRKEKNRKGQRRSSLTMRGRRASSLIESGASNALPHDKVNTRDFYKHISTDLVEPKRMRQLLTWCATRAMADKPSGKGAEDASVILAARVMQEEILKEFGNRSEMSNWFNREETAQKAVVVKKPNPKNQQNEEKIKELEGQIQRLRSEQASLQALLRPPSIPDITPKPQPRRQEHENNDSLASSTTSISTLKETIDPTFLNPTQRPLLSLLSEPPPIRPPSSDKTASPSHTKDSLSNPSIPAPSASATSIPALTTRLSRLTNSLLPTIDTFAASMHDIDTYRQSADSVAGTVLANCARLLEERHRRRGGLLASAGSGGSLDDSRLLGGDDLRPVLNALSRLER